MKNLFLLSTVCSAMMLSVSCRPEKSVDVPLHIAPLFTEKQARYYGNWLDGEYEKAATDKDGYSTAFGANNMGVRVFVAQVELYLLANQHLNSPSGKDKRTFYDSYRKWLEDYRKKCQAPLLDDEGVELEGTMTIGMREAQALELLEQYIETFKERPNLEYDFRKE